MLRYLLLAAVALPALANAQTINTPPAVGNLTVAGGFPLTFTVPTPGSNATLPSGAGTLAYLAGTNIWSGSQTFANGHANVMEMGRGFTITWSGTVSQTPSLLPLYVGMGATGTFSGSPLGLNRVAIAGDTVVAPGASVNGFYISHNFGGGSTAGSRSGLNVALNQTGSYAAGLTGFDAVQVGTTIFSTAAFDDSHGSGTAGGNVGLNVINTLQAGALNKATMEGVEVDMVIKAGASSNQKWGYLVNSSVGDTQQGTLIDQAYTVGQNDTATNPGWQCGYCIGNIASAFALSAANGVAFGVVPQSTATASPLKANAGVLGLNLFPASWSDRAIYTRGFAVNNAGSVVVGNATLSATASGAALDVPLLRLSGAAVAGGGGNAWVGEELLDDYGNVLRVSSVSAGAVTGVTITQAGAVTVAPTNPVHYVQPIVANVAAGDVTLNLTWSATLNTLKLNPSGGDVYAGPTTPLTATSVTGYFHLPAQTAAPTVAPTNTDVACAYNTATNVINCRNGAGWFKFTGTAGAG